jgi:hypothetical protein
MAVLSASKDWVSNKTIPKDNKVLSIFNGCFRLANVVFFFNSEYYFINYFQFNIDNYF